MSVHTKPSRHMYMDSCTYSLNQLQCLQSRLAACLGTLPELRIHHSSMVHLAGKPAVDRSFCDSWCSPCGVGLGGAAAGADPSQADPSRARSHQRHRACDRCGPVMDVEPG